MKKALALGLVGLMGLVGCIRKEPNRNDFKYNDWSGMLNPRAQLVDIDKDSMVDLIRDIDSPSVPYWVAEGYEKYGLGAGVMTDEMRDIATQILKLQNELQYQIDKRDYELSKEKRKE